MKQEDIKKSVFSPDISQFLYNIYNKLYEFWGPQNWWPAETKFEMVIGAILAQNISWNSAEKAICNLKRANILSVEGILQTPDEKLAELIKPAGYYNQKAKRLKEFCNFLKREFNSDLEKLFALDISSLRKALLSQKGIGFETADSIILYGAEKPIFVVDSYTKRLFYRLGLIESEKISYSDLQAIIMAKLTPQTKFFNEFHALIVKHCKEICKSKKPICNKCCLRLICNYLDEN
ncbi:HhH-GPD family protein [Caldicellulosiruptor owensensis OL]|uniref:HhH-GPD family protein n=1 Tax=Caldicellulosiruptor owensensis (strain ATCC 700167 / DSM 13100 / OL) TaxID=632518 RepID=E4Q4A9_CALOW|nr:endonuclease [Caldicellulosiruptor owensensis]ADQ04071.1 HhH-GPD family protein [Caldicellulosiruptor owensensis OL]